MQNTEAQPLGPNAGVLLFRTVTVDLGLTRLQVNFTPELPFPASLAHFCFKFKLNMPRVRVVVEAQTGTDRLSEAVCTKYEDQSHDLAEAGVLLKISVRSWQVFCKLHIHCAERQD